jgi:hypothetical protein
MVPFGPLMTGGLVHARILSRDALDADNDRYAYAAVGSPAHVLVLSSDASVRDDLARVLLAVNPNFIIASADPAKFSSSDSYRLAVLHDCYVPGIKAESVLMVFPPTTAAAPIAGLRITGTSAASMMTNEERTDASATPTMLASTRTMSVPEWMTVKAFGTAASAHEMLPLAASGSLVSGQFGLMAFDVRQHLLLDPDRLDALVVTVDLVRELTAPAQLRIISTGTYLALPVPPDAKVTGPAGSVVSISRDQWDRLRIRPLQPGLYAIEWPSGRTEVYANYYDAFESDLTALAAPSAPEPKKSARTTEASSASKQVQPLSMLLIAFALIAILLESGLLMRSANRWGMRHV